LELGNTLIAVSAILNGTKLTTSNFKDRPMAGHLTAPTSLVMQIPVVIKMGKRYLEEIYMVILEPSQIINFGRYCNASARASRHQVCIRVAPRNFAGASHTGASSAGASS